MPGNVLRPDNQRKTAVFYYSFREFGCALRCEHAWFPLAIIRHTILQKIVGGISTACKELLWHLFCSSVSLSSVGVVLRLDSPKLLFCRLTNVVGDEAALKGLWGAKGASGMKPCICCKNIVMKEAGFHQDVYLREISTERKHFDLSTNEDVWSISDHLEIQFRLLNKAAFSRLQTAVGLSWIATGVLANRDLRNHVQPISTNTFDSMHCLYSHGCASTELHLFLNAARSKAGLTFEQLQSYCSASWQHAKHVKCKPADIFSRSRQEASKDSDSFKGFASEVLSVFPLVRQLAETVLSNKNCLQLEMESFRSMHAVITTIERMKKEFPVSAASCQELQSALDKHLRAFVAAYGSAACKPKNHYTQHLADQIQRDQVVLDTFVLERKHRTTKYYAGQVSRLSAFEESVLARVLAENIEAAKEFSFADELVGTRADSKDIADALEVETATVAEQMRFRNYSIHVGDVLVAQHRVVVVAACVQTNASLQVLGRVYEHQSKFHYGLLWKKGASIVHFCPQTHEFHIPAFWSFEPDDILLTIG